MPKNNDQPEAPRRGLAMLAGAGGMTFVGGSVAVSGLLHDAPVATVQALRYGLAALLLLAVARRTGRRIVRPVGRQWAWLPAVTVSGLVVFNYGLVFGAAHAEPAVLGVAVACVPVLLAVLGPLLQQRRPAARPVLAAVVVTAGAALVQGFGHSDLTGLLWAVVVLCCEAGFTLFAVPVLGSLGPLSVSVHTTWLAAVCFAVLGVVVDGPGAVTRLDTGDLLAAGYLAVFVTAVAFLLWFSCVRRIGAPAAGLLTGVVPVAAAAVGVALGGPVPGHLVWTGIAVVAAGLVVGLRASRGAELSRSARGA